MRMSNVVNLKEYREAKERARLDEWAKMWIAYWFWFGGIR